MGDEGRLKGLVSWVVVGIQQQIWQFRQEMGMLLTGDERQRKR